MIDRPADYRDVVHPRRLHSRVFLVASTPPCIRIRDEAARPKGRDYWTTRLGDLDEMGLPEKWVMAAILCPEDDAEEIVQWLARHDADPERVLFVLHPETDPVQALAPWYTAGHDDPVSIEASTFQELARPLGMFVNDWIYVDAKGMDWPL